MSKIRKLNEPNRNFNSEWELGFFFISIKAKMMCLLCNTVLKKSNAKTHYLTHQDHKYFSLEGEIRQAALEKLKKGKHQEQATFVVFVKKTTSAVDVTYKIAHILGKKGKPFSDVEIINESIVEAVSRYVRS